MNETRAIEPLWTASDVAQYFNLSKKNGFKTVLNWVASGRLRAVRVGDLVRFRRSDIEEALEMGIR